MILIKWICFIFLCSDSLSYFFQAIADERINKNSYFLGFVLGVIGRLYALYGTYNYWLHM